MDVEDGWLLLAAKVVRGLKDPDELEEWRRWAENREANFAQSGSVLKHRAGRRIGHMSHVEIDPFERRRRKQHGK